MAKTIKPAAKDNQGEKPKPAIEKPVVALAIVPKPHKRLIDYTKKQLQQLEMQMKFFEAPIDPEKQPYERKVEEMILRNKVWQLRELLQAFECIIENE